MPVWGVLKSFTNRVGLAEHACVKSPIHLLDYLVTVSAPLNSPLLLGWSLSQLSVGETPQTDQQSITGPNTEVSQTVTHVWSHSKHPFIHFKAGSSRVGLYQTLFDVVKLHTDPVQPLPVIFWSVLQQKQIKMNSGLLGSIIVQRLAPVIYRRFTLSLVIQEFCLLFISQLKDRLSFQQEFTAQYMVCSSFACGISHQSERFYSNAENGAKTH